MISERKFAEAFTSFWHASLPTADAFIRRTNLRLRRFTEPTASTVTASRRALVNELAFRLFAASGQPPAIIKRLPARFVLGGTKSTTSRLVTLGIEPVVVRRLSKSERAEILYLANKLVLFFGTFERGGTVVANPSFPGCGLIDTCEGDVLTDDTLYEVKAGDRDFRLVDLRQVIVYCALNHAAGNMRIPNIGLVNPRVGVFFKATVDSVARESGAHSGVELLSKIVDFVSSNQTSL